MPSAPAANTGAPAALPLQPLHELHAPAHWGSIDFVSDLHLCQSLPRTFAAFENHLRNTSADAVFILGDLFELWVGDDMAERGFEAACTHMLAQASQRITLAFMVGNRDFLVGTAFMKHSGLLRLHDPTLLQAFGQRVLLSHGDAWCLADVPYQDFRREVRSSDWQARFLAQPLDERLRVAGEIRKASHQRQRFDGAAHADVDPAEALRWMQQADAPALVHGHTHKPGSQVLGPGRVRHVLSDWDLDQGQRAEVLRFSAKGCVRLPVAAG